MYTNQHATLGIFGIPSIFDIAKRAAGTFFGSPDRDPYRLCPGSPPIVADLAKAFTRDPALAAEIRADFVSRYADQKDLVVVRAGLGDPAMLAQAAVWLSWGGADCKTGTVEPPLQRRLINIARDYATEAATAVPEVPLRSAGLPPRGPIIGPTIAGIPAPSGANVALLLGVAVLAGALFGGRKRAR